MFHHKHYREFKVANQMLTVQDVTCFEGWTQIENQWRALIEITKEESPFMTWEWLNSWLRHFGANRELHILVCKEAEQTVAILPLLARRRQRLGVSVSTLSLLGAGLSDRLAVLVKPGRKDALSALASWLRTHQNYWDHLVLDDLDTQDTNARDLLALLNEFRLRGSIQDSTRSPYVRVDTDWEQFYEARFSSKSRSKNRLKLRKLDELGVVKFRWITEREEYLSAFDLICSMDERPQYQGTIRFRPFDSPVGRRFFRDVGIEFSKRGWMFLSLLEVDQSVVAYRIGFRYQGRHFDYFLGFRPDVSRLSPGRLLMKEVMENCVNNNIREVDLLRGDEKWKAEWANQTRTNCTLSAINTGLPSQIRRAVQKLP